MQEPVELQQVYGWWYELYVSFDALSPVLVPQQGWLLQVSVELLH